MYLSSVFATSKLLFNGDERMLHKEDAPCPAACGVAH